MAALSPLRLAVTRLTRGLELPDPRENRGRFLLNLLGTFKLNRRAQKIEQLQAYSGWVAAAVNAISADVRQAEWQLGESTGPNLTDFDPFEGELPRLFTLPDRMTTFGTLLQVSTKHLDLAGEAFWWMVTGSDTGGGPVQGIQAVPPHFITEPIYSETERRFVAWRFNNGVIDRPLPFEDVIWFRYPHPLEPWRGASPVEQVALSHDMDLFAKAYGTQLLEAGGVPPGIVTLDQEVDPKTARIIQQRWKKQRQEDPSNIAVLGKGAKFDRAGAFMDDLQFMEMARMNRDQVLGIYGVPAAKLGLVEDVNRANADGVNREYARNALKPRFTIFAEGINVWLIPRIPELEGLEFRFNDPIEPDKEFKLKRASDGFKIGLISVDEYRQETQRDPLGSENGGDLYRRNGTLRDGLEEEEPPMPGGPNEPGNNNPPANNNSSQENERESRRMLANAVAKAIFDQPAMKQIITRFGEMDTPQGGTFDPGEAIEGYFREINVDTTNSDAVIAGMQARGLLPIDMPISERQLRDGANRFQIQQEGLEREMRQALRRLWAQERDAVVKRIRELKNPPQIDTRMHMGPPEIADWFELEEWFAKGNTDKTIWHEHDVLVAESDDPTLQKDLLDIIFNRQERSWANMIARFIRDGFERGWILLTQDLDRELLDFSRMEREVEALAQREAPGRVRQMRGTTRRRIAATVKAGIAAGLTTEAIAESVHRVYDTFRGSRSATVSRTETAQYVNRGKDLHEREATQVLGAQIRNTWSAILDERVREAHEVANGQVRLLGEEFAVGGEGLRHPHDPDGSASNVINCRCTLISEFVNEERNMDGDRDRRRKKRKKKKRSYTRRD